MYDDNNILTHRVEYLENCNNELAKALARKNSEYLELKNKLTELAR